MRLHVVGFPHTETTREYVTCAYTQKIVKAGSMFNLLGHDVIVYAGERNETVCSEHVPIVSAAERVKWFGEHSQNNLWGGVDFDATSEPWRVMNRRAVAAIRKRKLGADDLVLLLGGNAQRPIANELSDMTVIEWGAGYEGVFTNYIAFESNAWRHFVYGKWIAKDTIGRFYDAVIPNFFEPDKFRLAPKGDYLLFLGRVIKNKGPDIAAEIAKRLGMKLVVAGPGAMQPIKGSKKGIVIGDGVEFGGDVEYVGPVDEERRAELLSRAVALLVPTTFLEPFGGVAVEAMLSGTPAVTTDWGAFPETVTTGVTGYRFNRVAEGVRAVEAARLLDPGSIRREAIRRYSTDAIGPLYDHWFGRLAGLSTGNDFYGEEAPPVAPPALSVVPPLSPVMPAPLPAKPGTRARGASAGKKRAG